MWRPSDSPAPNRDPSLKILQVISHYVPAYRFGGPLQVAHGLAKALVRAGHEVTVCCTNLQDPHCALDVPVDVPVMVDGVKVYYAPVSTAGRYWGYSPVLRRRVQEEAKLADCVMTHFHFQYASVIGGRSARVAGKPLVVFTHGSLNRHGLKARSRFLKSAYLALLEAPNFRAARHVAYQSEFELEMSVRHANPIIVPIGLDALRTEDLPPAGAFRQLHPEIGRRFMFAFMGRLAPGKGLELLIPAFHRLVAQRDAHLTLIGGDERGHEGRLRALVRQHGLDERVTFTGLLQGTDKLAALQDADAFVLPSRSEGTSLATLEAMSIGLPVIVTDRVGLSHEVSRQDCGLVIPYAEAALATALAALAGRSDLREMGARGRRFARENFSWDNIARDLLVRLSPPSGQS